MLLFISYHLCDSCFCKTFSAWPQSLPPILLKSILLAANYWLCLHPTKFFHVPLPLQVHFTQPGMSPFFSMGSSFKIQLTVRLSVTPSSNYPDKKDASSCYAPRPSVPISSLNPAWLEFLEERDPSAYFGDQVCNHSHQNCAIILA